MPPWVSAPICWHYVLNQPVHPSIQRLHTPDCSSSDSFFHTNNKRISPKRENPLCKYKPPHTLLPYAYPFLFLPSLTLNPGPTDLHAISYPCQVPSFLYLPFQNFILQSSFSSQSRHHLSQNVFPSAQNCVSYTEH